MFARTAAALAAGTALFALAAPAEAQRIDRIVTFGDSYADDGNFFQLVNTNPASTGVYTTGRFSGGTNYVDTLSQLLNAPVENYAIGGARTNNTNQTPGVPGFTFEVNSFLAGGGGVFPLSTPSFGEGDLVTVSIGGNDSRAYQIGGGTVAGAPAAAATAAASATTNLNRLVAAGAPTISFLAGDTGRLPEVQFTANPAAAAASRTAFSTAFNSAMQTTLAGYAANGVVVHYLDLSRVLDVVSANLPAFGLQAIACPAFPPPIGPGNPGSTQCATSSSTYLVYGDQLHLTSAGFAIVARYIERQLAAPLALQAPAELGMATARAFGRTLSSRVDLAAPRDGGDEGGVRFFLAGDMGSFAVDRSSRNDAMEIDTKGLTAGVEFGGPNVLVGIAGNLSRPKTRIISDTLDADGDSLQLGGYAGFGIGGAFLQGYAAYGWNDYELERRGVLTPMTATTDGSHWVIGGKAGYLFPAGPARVGPIVTLDYAKSKVDGFSESGDPALALNVGAQSYRTLVGGIGLEARTELDMGGAAIRPFIAATLEEDLKGDQRSLTFAQQSAPGVVNSYQLSTVSKGTYGRLAGGFGTAIAGALRFDAAASGTFGRDDGDEVNASVALRLGF